MICGIDAHCIRGQGGSITHLREVLRVANPALSGFSKVLLWSGRSTLDRVEDRPWLEKMHVPQLDGNLVTRSRWSATKVADIATAAGCDVLWLPGCSYAGKFRPFVAMSRNMLPFEWSEMMRYGPSARFMKFLSLRFSQARTYRRANGTMYLTEYARKHVGAVVGDAAGDSRVIPHGIEARFAENRATRQEKPALGMNKGPVHLLYVSIVDLYKHQWHVIEAVEILQRSGFDVELTLVGPMFKGAEKKFRAAVEDFKGTPGSVKYLGAVSHADIHRHYQEADVFIYASSCENLPNILLEAMAAGVPIACSSRGPMPEILKDAGEYFDPESPVDIAAAVRLLIESPALMQRKGRLAAEYSESYSWERCAAESFGYLADVAQRDSFISGTKRSQ